MKAYLEDFTIVKVIIDFKNLLHLKKWYANIYIKNCGTFLTKKVKP